MRLLVLTSIALEGLANFILYETCNYSYEHFNSSHSIQTSLRVEKRLFYFKLINLLIKELNNCSLGAISESRAMPKYELSQFHRFSIEINFKRARDCNYGITRLGSSLKNVLYQSANCYSGHLS